MRKLMIAAVTALAFASAAHAGSPHCDKGKKPCDNTCIAQHLVCRAPAGLPRARLSPAMRLAEVQTLREHLHSQARRLPQGLTRQRILTLAFAPEAATNPSAYRVR